RLATNGVGDFINAFNIDKSGVHVHGQHLEIAQFLARRHESIVQAILFGTFTHQLSSGLVIRYAFQAHNMGAECYGASSGAKSLQTIDGSGTEGRALQNEVHESRVTRKISSGEVMPLLIQRAPSCRMVCMPAALAATCSCCSPALSCIRRRRLSSIANSS